MKSCVFLLSPSYMVGVSPTSLPCCGCGIPIGGGPHPPPGGLAPGGPPPPPGYPPPPPGTPPPGNPLGGLSSCGRQIGGSSGSCSSPLLGGSGLSGSWARCKAISSSTVLTPCVVRCPVC